MVPEPESVGLSIDEETQRESFIRTLEETVTDDDMKTGKMSGIDILSRMTNNMANRMTYSAFGGINATSINRQSGDIFNEINNSNKLQLEEYKARKSTG